MRLLIVSLTSVILCVISISPTTGQAPDLLSFQGFVTDVGGASINDPGVSMTFKLYEGTSAIWSETQSSVEIVEGVFNVMLGSVISLDTVRFDRPLSLGIKVGSSQEISPRTPLAAAAYSKALPGLYTYYRDSGTLKGYNVVGGGPNNVVGAATHGTTIGGGGGFHYGDKPNSVLNDFATVSGGYSNIGSGFGSTVGGGTGNTASGKVSVVGGGNGNTATDENATVGGGDRNKAGGLSTTIAGGYKNEARGGGSTVGGGNSNVAEAATTTVGGGQSNQADGPSSTIGGGSGNTTAGSWATVPGGSENSARGIASFAAGWHSKAIHDGTFVWNDRSVTIGNDSLVSSGANQFLIRAAGGVAIGTNSPRAMLTLRGPDEVTMGPSLVFLGNAGNQVEAGRVRFMDGISATNLRGSYIHYDASRNRLHIGVHDATNQLPTSDIDIITIERASGDVGIKRDNPAYPLHVGTDGTNGNGAHVTIGGTWTSGSSRTFKEDLRQIDGSSVLQKVLDLPLYRWRYKRSDEGDHMGPVAEDFFEAFKLGDDERYISSVDGNGVALAAIQGLYEIVRQQQAEIERLKQIAADTH